jgi:uncharacterized protein (DUF4415 family)
MKEPGDGKVPKLGVAGTARRSTVSLAPYQNDCWLKLPTGARSADSNHFHSKSRCFRKVSICTVLTMKKQFDFSKSKANPYIRATKKQVTIRLDTTTIAYFKDLSASTGIPYQNLINLYLRDCAMDKKRLKLGWAA